MFISNLAVIMLINEEYSIMNLMNSLKNKTAISRAFGLLFPIVVFAVMFGFNVDVAHADNIYVRDNAGVLSENVKDEIRNFNKKMESSDSGAQLLVVTVDSIPDGQNIEDYSMSLAEKYKPGDGSKDTGLVYVVAVNDHKDRLEVGYGLEEIIPDSMASRILQSRTDAYRSGDWNAGVEAVVNGISEQIMNPKQGEYEYRDDGDSGAFLTALKIFLAIVLTIGIGGLIVMIIGGILESNDVYGDGTDYYTPSIGDEAVISTAAASAVAGSSRRRHDDDDDDSITPTSSSYSSSNDYSSSSFSSFDSFGGGSFGGGGASGSW